MYVYVCIYICIYILSSSADSFAKSEVSRRVSEAEPATSAPASGVPPNEHGTHFVFHTAVEPDSLIALFRHV